MSSCFSKLLLMVALIVGTAVGTSLYYKSVVLDQSQTQHRMELEREQSTVQAINTKLSGLEVERKRIEQELIESQTKAKELASALESVKQQPHDTSALDTKIAQLVDYKKKLHTSLKQYARRQVLEKFGPGPHRVEIQLGFDPNSNVYQAEGGDRIVIEMAPLADMPYTVWWFLNQVDRGLYDMTSFHRNAGHGKGMRVLFEHDIIF